MYDGKPPYHLLTFHTVTINFQAWFESSLGNILGTHIITVFVVEGLSPLPTRREKRKPMAEGPVISKTILQNI
jgi:hypothetical protein